MIGTTRRGKRVHQVKRFRKNCVHLIYFWATADKLGDLTIQVKQVQLKKPACIALRTRMPSNEMQMIKICMGACPLYPPQENVHTKEAPKIRKIFSSVASQVNKFQVQVNKVLYNMQLPLSSLPFDLGPVHPANHLPCYSLPASLFCYLASADSYFQQLHRIKYPFSFIFYIFVSFNLCKQRAKYESPLLSVVVRLLTNAKYSYFKYQIAYL